MQILCLPPPACRVLHPLDPSSAMDPGKSDQDIRGGVPYPSLSWVGVRGQQSPGASTPEWDFNGVYPGFFFPCLRSPSVFVWGGGPGHVSAGLVCCLFGSPPLAAMRAACSPCVFRGIFWRELLRDLSSCRGGTIRISGFVCCPLPGGHAVPLPI